MKDDDAIIEREVLIAEVPEVVFGFHVDPLLMMRWIGLSHTLEPRPGGVFRVEISRGNVACGLYTEVTPPRRVAFTWGWESQAPSLAALPPGASLVEIELESRSGGTLLSLRHSRLPRAVSQIHGDRWLVHLGRLAAVLS